MRSRIYTNERVQNLDRRFGSALGYVPARVVRVDYDGRREVRTALFTRAQIHAALDRGKANPEDIPPVTLRERLSLAWAAIRG